MAPFFLALIGLGGYAKEYFKAIEGLGRGVCGLRAVYVRSPGKYAAEIEALKKEDIRVFTEYQALLEAERGKSALVIVPAAIDQHESLSVQALEAGFDVLCEKPLTGTIASAGRMAAAMKRSGRRIAVGYQHVYSPGIQHIKRLRSEGALGALRRAKTRLLFPRSTLYYKRNAWAGKLHFLGIPIFDSILQNAGAHSLQNMLYIAGQGRHETAAASLVEAEQFRAYPIESSDTQYLRVVTGEGAEMAIWASHAHALRLEPLAEYEFENGRITWEAGRNGRVTVFRKNSSGSHEIIEETDNGVRPLLEHMLKNVIETMRSDREPLCGLENSRQHTSVIETMFRNVRIASIPETVIEKIPLPDHPGELILSVKGLDALIEKGFSEEKSLSQAGIRQLQSTSSSR